MFRNFHHISMIVFLAGTLLTGCVNVATSGAQALYNHRNLQKSLNDQMATFRVYQALNSPSGDFKNTHIDVTTYNSEVLLAGQVRYEWQRTKLEKIVREMPDVHHVYNLVTVASPSSTLTRLSDAWLTAKVKAKLIASSDVDATQIKVMTENGTVYLMGVLPPEEAQVAIEVARTTDGVQNVVKAFSYIRIIRT